MRHRHKWVKDTDGKQCERCGSRINTRLGMIRYIQGYEDGYSNGENYYPVCFKKE